MKPIDANKGRLVYSPACPLLGSEMSESHTFFVF